MMYLLVSGVLLTYLRRPTGRLTVIEQKLEGEFRYINSRLITNPATTQSNVPKQTVRSRDRAIRIDRFSRVFFPLLFAVLNATYWIMFYKYI